MLYNLVFSIKHLQVMLVMQQLSEFVTNNLMLFAALAVVLVLLIKAEIDHMAIKGYLLSPAKAIRLMNNNSEILVLDIRSVAEFKAGHIKGAKNIPAKDISNQLTGYTNFKDKPVLVYCNTGSSVTSAIKSLKNAGFEHINNLEGGIAAWKEANMPLSKK